MSLSPTDTLTFIFNELPVSVNNLYVPTRGRLTITKTGKRWKNKFITSRGGLSALVLSTFNGDREMTYDFDLWLYMPEDDLVNPRYGTGDKRVKHAFKQFDASNLIKLTEDAVADLICVDDRNNFDVHVHKRPCRGPAHIVVHVSPSLLPPDPRDPR